MKILAVPCFLMGMATLAAAWVFLAKPQIQLLEQVREVESSSARIAWKTSPACYSQVEYWPAGSPAERLRTKRLPVPQSEHNHQLKDLRTDSTYNFRFLFTYDAEGDRRMTASDVFEFPTRPEIQVLNIHVEEQQQKVIITWETNIRTDTTIKYGRTEYEEQKGNPDQRQDCIHSISLEGLAPNTTYHYQIVANDPKGRAQPKATDDLTFRTASLDPSQPLMNSPAGLLSIVRSYADKLSRMTPEERTKLKRSLDINTGTNAQLSEAAKAELLKSNTNPTRASDFAGRLQKASTWVSALKADGNDDGQWRADLTRVQKLYYTNPVKAARGLDALLQKLSAAEKP